MFPVLLNVSIGGCRPFPALSLSGRALALSWWKNTALAYIHHVDQLMESWALNESILRSICCSPDVAKSIAAHGVDVERLRIHAPIEPRQIYCSIGNYRSQVLEAAADAGDGATGPGADARRTAASTMLDLRRRHGRPYVCVKPASSLADPFSNMPLASDEETLDWEVEVGVVIGRTAWQVRPADALRHVAGYCVVNDITLRDRVFRADPPLLGTDWLQSKGGPGWLPVGPWLVPSWNVSDVTALRPWLKLNGTTMQDGCSDDMVFGIAEQISYLSQHTRLHPGDLLCTGSPAGFGSHHRRYLAVGDVVEAGAPGLGTQRITCVAEVPAFH